MHIQIGKKDLFFEYELHFLMIIHYRSKSWGQ